MAIYQRAKPDHDVHGVLAEARRRWHADLDRYEVTVDVLFAWAGKNGGAALKLHGWPCEATIKPTAYRDRVRGAGDVLLTLDAAVWEAKTPDERLALIDHELEHLVIQRDKDEAVKSDDHGRPKIKTRPHDYELGGFASVARRHGHHAPEVQSFRAVYDEHRQLLLPWGDDNVEPDEIAGRIQDVLSA